jgi:hypothetical protein
VQKQNSTQTFSSFCTKVNGKRIKKGWRKSYVGWKEWGREGGREMGVRPNITEFGHDG